MLSMENLWKGKVIHIPVLPLMAIQLWANALPHWASAYTFVKYSKGYINTL